MIELHVQKCSGLSREAFTSTHPAYSIALDGYVAAEPFLEIHPTGPYRNFNHHEAVDHPTSPVRMETIEVIGPPHTRPALVPPSSLPMSHTTCPACDTPSSVTFTREEERFPYGIAPHTVELTALVDKGRCSACAFEFTDWRAEKALDKAVQIHLASLTTEDQT